MPVAWTRLIVVGNEGVYILEVELIELANGCDAGSEKKEGNQRCSLDF